MLLNNIFFLKALTVLGGKQTSAAIGAYITKYYPLATLAKTWKNSVAGTLSGT